MSADNNERTRPKTPTLLETYVSGVLQHHPSLSGRAAAVKWITDDINNAYALAASNCCSDLKVNSSKCLPPMLGITFTRDNIGSVRTITDGTKTIAGPVLSRLTANVGAASSGYQRLIYAHLRGSGDSGLMIPKHNIEDWTYSTKKEGELVVDHDGKRVITKTQVFNLALTVPDVQSLVELDAIPITDWPAILKELSTLRKVDTDYDITGLMTLADITNARLDKNLRKNHVALLDALQSGILHGASISDKVDAFVENPTYKFFAKLKLLRPYSKSLYDAHNKPFKNSTLSSQPPTGYVILQDLAFDGGFYENKLNLNMMVYPPGDYRVKVGKQFNVVSGLKQMLVSDLMRIVAAKETAVSARARSGTAGIVESNDSLAGQGDLLNINI